MSVDTDIEFNITYDGKFQTKNGEVAYIGGKTHVLQTSAHTMFSGIVAAYIVDVYGQRVWYKLPYEDLKDLKLLCDGSSNFDNMCKAALWTRVVEIYMESEEKVEAENTFPYNVEVNGVSNEGANGASNVGDDDDAIQQNARVEEIVAGFVDEKEENDMDRDTPPASDCDKEHNDITTERWRRGTGELKIMQVFESVAEFKEAVLEYALKGGWNIKYTRWRNVKCEEKCAVKGEVTCYWRIYCSFEEALGMWMVKTFQEEHSCTPDEYCKLLTDHVIAQLVINEIINDFELMPKAIQDLIEEQYNLTVTHDICRKARKRALDMIYHEFVEQYERIKDYRDHIIRKNPGSIVVLLTATRDDGVEVFQSFYVCFKALRSIWVNHCRPIFGIDGCFLKSTTKGQLLAAVGRDTNNQIYPIAWAFVKVEDTDRLQWFLQQLKNDLDLKDGDGFTLISDKQKGLLNAVDTELPKVEHRTCARHVYGNLKKIHPKKPQMKKLFWAISDSFNEVDYQVAMNKLMAYDVNVYDNLVKRNHSLSSRAFFKTTSTCADALNNFNESYNSGLEKARGLSLVEMLETMRRQTMVHIELRKNKSNKHKGRYSIKVSKTLASEKKELKWCKRIHGPNGSSEVSKKGTSYAVSLNNNTCSCRKWDMTGIPCRHALKVLVEKKYDAKDYVVDCYLTTTWRQQYSDSITPVDGFKFWRNSGASILKAPPREVNKGRNKKPEKRKKSINESPTKGEKLSRHLKIVHCYRCGFSGHNSAGYSIDGVPYKPRKIYNRKTAEDVAESISLEVGEGPSQSQNYPTQTSSPTFD